MRNNYLRWLMKSRKITILFFTVVYIGFLYTPYLENNSFLYDYQNYLYTRSLSIGVGMSVFLAFALPIFLFSYMHRKRSVDVYLALPISRRQQLFSSAFFAWLLAYGWFALGTLMIWILKGNVSMDLLGHWLRIQPWMMFSLAVLIFVTAAFYMSANNVFDGIVMVIAYYVVPVFITLVFQLFINDMIAGQYYSGTFSNIGKWFSPVFMAVSNSLSLLGNDDLLFSWAYFWLLAVYGLLAVVALHFSFIRRKSERAEQISDSFFAYPFVINIYAALILLVYGFTVVSGTSQDMILFYMLLFFIYIIASFIYRRSLKISWRPIALFLGMAAITLGFSFIGWKTQGFGLSYAYRLDTNRYLTYHYTAEVDAKNLGAWFEVDDGEDRDDSQREVNVQFTLVIPTDQLQEKQEIVSLMESIRKDSIRAFYEKKEPTRYYAYLNVCSKMREEDLDYDGYGYPLNRLLSEEELKKIAKYCDVEVSDFTALETEEMPLEQYLGEHPLRKNS